MLPRIPLAICNRDDFLGVGVEVGVGVKLEERGGGELCARVHDVMLYTCATVTRSTY